MGKINLDVDDIAKLYLSGKSMPEIAEQFGTSFTTIWARLHEAGIKIRNRSEARRLCRKHRADLDAGKIGALYESGYSEPELSKKFKAGRDTIRHRLEEAGVKKRTDSENMKLRMSRLSPAERLRFTAAAHAAVRGIKQSDEHRMKVALGRERNQSGIGPAEINLAGRLRHHNLSVTPQKAVGRYNIDIAIHEGSVAVEIFGGNWHASGRHARRFRQRCDYLLDCGWLPVIIWVTKNFPIKTPVIKYLVALSEKRRLDKSFGHQEFVIRGDGYIAAGKHNFHNGTIVRTRESFYRPRDKNGRFAK